MTTIYKGTGHSRRVELYTMEFNGETYTAKRTNFSGEPVQYDFSLVDGCYGLKVSDTDLQQKLGQKLEEERVSAMSVRA